MDAASAAGDERGDVESGAAHKKLPIHSPNKVSDAMTDAQRSSFTLSTAFKALNDPEADQSRRRLMVLQPAYFEEMLQGERLIEPYTRTSFLAFCRRCYCEENLHFWADVELLKRRKGVPGAVEPEPELLLVPTDAQRDDKKWTSALVTTYIENGAPRQINISSSQKQGVLDRVQSLPPGAPEIFAEAQAEVKRVMKDDTWKRFVNKTLTENLTEGESRYRLFMGTLLVVVNILLIAIFLDTHLNRWIMLVTAVTWFTALDYLWASQSKVCISKAAWGLRMRDDVKGWLRMRIDTSCDINIRDPVVLAALRRRGRIQAVRTAILALIMAWACFALTYVVEAATGHVGQIYSQ